MAILRTGTIVGLLVVIVNGHRVNIDWSQVKSITEFDHYWQRLPAKIRDLRYKHPSIRIVGGVEATPGQFPYQAALLSEFTVGTGLCGATLITHNYILTAAHCVIGGDGKPALKGTTILGAHDRTQMEASQQHIPYPQSSITAHPHYNSNTIRNDIATVYLPTAAKFNDRVQPIALPAYSDDRSFAGMEGIASGFGRTSDNSIATSPVVMFTRNSILSNEECNTFWDTSLVSDQNVCLDPTGGTSACNGDSGGPLAVEDDDGRSLQIGITSFVSAKGCASGAPPVWVRVSYYRDWIEDNSDYVFSA
ncbi:brachyurin-like [Anopheles cruzii]|uniref:brachyurin-like n=1 Tax=Anopheles cruzii TaxID=68878 RepID=UPI0022EC57C5|nr:brachyurin-like [Anopheles cruzii]